MTGQINAGQAASIEGHMGLGSEQRVADGHSRGAATAEVLYRIATMMAVIFLLATVVQAVFG